MLGITLNTGQSPEDSLDSASAKIGENALLLSIYESTCKQQQQQQND